MKYLKLFETFTLGDLDDYDKNDLVDLLDFYENRYDFVKDKEDEIEEIIKGSIDKFKREIPIFDKIHIQLVKIIDDNALGMYVHESVLKIPVILLSLDALKDAVNDGHELDIAVRSTIYHELGHVMVDLDNQIEFIEGENILHFEDEEDYVEDFAFDFDMFGTIPDEIDELIKQYKNYNK